MALESFFGLDQADGNMSPEALEAFKERMRQNAAHIAAIKKDEGKQKKKEDKLIKVLLKFIQSGQHSHIVNLLAKLLAENIPASFIVSVLSLNYPELQREIDINLSLPQGPESLNKSASQAPVEVAEPNNPEKSSALAFFNTAGMPLEIKVALDLWFQAISEAMENYPQKILKTVQDPLIEDDIKPKIVVVQLAAVILRDFLEKKNANPPTERLREFMLKMLEQMLKKIKDDTENRKLLK